jgi:hypothetical protein
MIDRFYIPSINSIYLKGLVPTISTLSVGLFRIKTQQEFPFGARRLRVAILSDSQYALRAI